MHKILVANRGAVARRVIRACGELGIASVAVYSEADADAPYLSEASEAFVLPGVSASDTYLDQQKLLEIQRITQADGVHPGYGFLSENAHYAQAVEDAGAKFIGPRPEWLERMGEKVAARELMSTHGFPIFPGSELLVDAEQAKVSARQIGFPVLVKPAGGGGGMGMEVVADEAQLEHALARSRTIAERAFASSGVYLERWIPNPRHIEFQMLADEHGHVKHAFERECSVQRRNQKLIEESPAPGLDAGELERQAQLAQQVLAKLGYNNLGTVETLLDEKGGIGFLEMNTRLQVEHGVTEEVTGLDLVALQIELAGGGALPTAINRSGHAIEARIYAEDAQRLLPSTGRLQVFRPPNMHGIRVESGYQEGQQVTPYYDAMLAKVISYAPTRELAIGRLGVALRGFEIRGVETNIALLATVLTDADFVAGQVHTGIVERLLKR